MSDRLRALFAELEKLPAEEQESFGAFMMSELMDELAWQRKFQASPDLLVRLASEARAERESGLAKPADDLLG